VRSVVFEAASNLFYGRVHSQSQGLKADPMQVDIINDDLAMALEHKPLVGLQPVDRVSQAE